MTMLSITEKDKIYSDFKQLFENFILINGQIKNFDFPKIIKENNFDSHGAHDEFTFKHEEFCCYLNRNTYTNTCIKNDYLRTRNQLIILKSDIERLRPLINHENIVKIYGASFEFDSLYICKEYVDTSLRNVSNYFQKLNEQN